MTTKRSGSATKPTHDQTREAPTDPAAAEPAQTAQPAPAAQPAPPVALYIHVPFCVSLCPYCDFVVVAGAAARGPSNRIALFAAALETEIGLRADALDARFGLPGSARRPALDTVYLGGGTPSLV
ncbi:MAG: hypothetical protein QOI09_417, partial [Chloroflexota bacterium]|nr:hypothetical protein [Chloroflexota bacterium]